MRINESDCSLTYYRYYLSDKKNYIPIFVIDVPYTSKQVSIYDSFNCDVGNLFGIADIDTLPIWGEIATHVDSTTQRVTYSHYYPYTSYDDGLVTVSTSINLKDNSLSLVATFDKYAPFRIGAALPPENYPTAKEGFLSSITIAQTFLHFTDDVYCTGLAKYFILTTNDNRAIMSNKFPDTGKKGSFGVYGSSITKSTFRPQITNDRNDDLHARKILGKSKKIDIKDPDPNIDDSDGDKNRTPTSEIGGDVIGDDDLPTLSVMDTGLVTLYNPTVKELGDLGRFLWSDAFSLDTFKKLFSDPFDTLLGLSILPVTPTVSGRHNIYFGNIDSGVSCNVVANQFLKVDMGSLTLSETYASAFDYAPSTQVDIYLPFIGSHGLNTNDVMGSTLHLIYKFDLLSGGCIAELFINHTSQGNKSKGLSYNPNMGLAYTFTGQCSCSIPLTSNNYNGMIQSIIQSVGTVGAIGASVATGNPALGVASVATSATTIGLQANTPTVQRSGSIGSSNALLSCLTPYLSVQRAHICKPGHFYSKRGLPSQVYVDKISSVGSGNYFQIADCADLHANGASDTELAEIKSILTSGAVW